MKMNLSFAFCWLVLLAVLSVPTSASAQQEAVAYSGVTESRTQFRENCAVCHGDDLEGAAQGTPLRGELRHGESMADVVAGITNGYVDNGMPKWDDIFSPVEIRGLAMYVLETRANVGYVTSNYDAPLLVPDDVFDTQLHSFRLETVVDDLDPLPFSLAPLPDGRLLVTEKTKGVRVISPDGDTSALIRGTPQAYDDIYRTELRIDIERGMGWLFDILPHPDYEENGWIYLYHGHRCEDCNEVSRERGRPVSMNRLVRGRIEDGAWVDQEVIWQADLEDYSLAGDVGAGGRAVFDDQGHIYFSLGSAGDMRGIQDLSKPWGKIHRINDDGTIPSDNPFATRDEYPSVYTYGHRSPQGLEFDPAEGQLWGSEHGPRGGDEINLLLPGRNYGWPLFSLGLDYDGTPVEYGEALGVPFELSDIEQPVVDLTPSPAVSSFIISTSDQFPGWKGDFLVGSLKARSLFRVEIDNGQFVAQETLFEGIGRLRDIEQGVDGDIYLLFEHSAGGRIVRLVPVEWVTVPLEDGVYFETPPTHRTDQVEIPVPANSSLEYMLEMKQGHSVSYEWRAVGVSDPDRLLAEFHGHTIRESHAPGSVMFFKQGRAETSLGYLVAPFDGVHGWYFSNETDRDITITLSLSGFYTIP